MQIGIHMNRFTLYYFINFTFMEFIFHFYFWKDLRIWVLPAVAVAALVALVQALVLDFMKGRAQRIFFWLFMVINYLLFGSQLVYHSIFKQPLLLDAVLIGGGDALTNYWREAIAGIVNAGLGLVALFLGIVWTIVVRKLDKEKHTASRKKSVAIHLGCMAATVVFLTGTFFGFYKLAPEQYDDYQSFYYPDEVLERFGVLSFAMQDLGVMPLPEREEDYSDVFGNGVLADKNGADHKKDAWQETDMAAQPTATEQPVEYAPHVLEVNLDYLREIGTDEVDGVTDMVVSIEPTMENEYTGFFKDKNLIYITAEGFSTAAVDAELTPTLYQLTHSGVVVPEYYVPLWQTSTSDGEYVNLTGLIPDQQFSMKRSADNSQPYSLAHYFKSEGVPCYAYHNNTLSYYDRYLSHPNLGYNFKAAKLGDLDQEEWGSQLFTMEHPNYWPASDLEMMKATIPEFVNEERFHVYYLTVSGHMNYNFKGNRMSSLHAEEVQDLPYSEEGRAYIACNIELDRAIAYLIEQLYAAGKLEDTVICLSADHYPYGMNIDTYEELTGMSDLENSLDIYRNSLILWNAGMDTITVQEPCSSLDLMPTLLNLFGFDYDSRLFSGRDIFSDREPLVIFANRSFITDKASYNKKTGEVFSRTGEEVSEEYINGMKKYVRMLYKHSAGILNNDYYRYFSEAVGK